MNTSELVTTEHLKLKAIIYVRQSTLYQTLNHQESLKLQYALRDRAKELGWRSSLIEIIDNDLGLTGTQANHREGFKQLITQVTLGEVGIILSFDVTRLSRNCSDWYPLLDVCGYRRCLIADRDGVYDPGSSNGRLLLGLKGQLAEAELSTIRSRLTARLLNKAKRGELALALPAGLIRHKTGEVVKDPNLEVQSGISRVFEVFLSVRTVSKTLAYFHQHNLKVPRYDKFHQLIWRKPTGTILCAILKNPAYAGMFVYGRRCNIKTGPLSTDKKIKMLPRDQWKIVIEDKYPPYISVETYEKIESMLQQNYAEYHRNRTRGVPRNGAALLQGMIYCAKCGHKMSTSYKKGNTYICHYLHRAHLTPTCQYISADPLDYYVVECFFEAISPIELNAYEETVASQTQERQSLMQAKNQQLERLRYQAKLAELRFNEVDPTNRLVASELEKRWDTALQTLNACEKEYEKLSQHKPNIMLSEEMKIIFSNIGKHLPEIWHTDKLSRQQRKAFLRCLIDKVSVCKKGCDQLSIRIVWKGNKVTTKLLPIRVNDFNALSFSQEMEKRIIALSREGEEDKSIAKKLTQEGYRSPMKSYVIPSTVQKIRLENGILRKKAQSHPLIKEGYLSITTIAKKINVDRHWIYDRIRNGCILIEKYHRAYLFPDEDKTIEVLEKLKNGELDHLNFREKSPPPLLEKHDYLPIAVIAEKLNVSRYWIYDRIKDGRILVKKAYNTYLFPKSDQTIEAFKRLKSGQLRQLDFRGGYQHV